MPRKKKAPDQKGYWLAGLVGSLIGIISAIVSLRFIPLIIKQVVKVVRKKK
ncbi:MAG: hypothetical protein ABIE84_03195 [bacterium]